MPRKSPHDHATNRSQDDYPLRYAPSSYRRWSPVTVAITALGESPIWLISPSGLPSPSLMGH